MPDDLFAKNNLFNWGRRGRNQIKSASESLMVRKRWAEL